MEDLDIHWVDYIRMDEEQIGMDYGLDLSCVGYRPAAGCCERCSQLLGSIGGA